MEGCRFIYHSEGNSKKNGSVWEIEEKQFQETAIKARECIYNIIDEFLRFRCRESNSFCATHKLKLPKDKETTRV